MRFNFNLINVPTRWGNKLIGNVDSNRLHPSRLKQVPTRWGNKLIGNAQVQGLTLPHIWSPLAGETN